ncbi:hypothetical protein SAMN05216419_10586 [Nitrosomonas cryotolerans]|uniref:Uncharacterized protein n=1 Tax=Nitrosomonas cryotolerans ATCC 49181 TaxID=1131553 RepID=A0A1N6HPT8_9PROT|nr:hypothetical protein [Nitrosomonas cryotolerans]SFQ08326.1 hypothetical protein SAMN05216419_10586 [Nitrosomonas cryotolerans]SIO21773.1 hypothetical protein SAMN02743940_1292 [Nitrosomonas cryotolerans ATCC 49181]
MRFPAILFLSLMYFPTAIAENIENLQQRASFAYEQMVKAKYEAELSEKDNAEIADKVRRIKQQLLKVEQEAEITRKKLEQANLIKERAINEWNRASEVLARKWEESKMQY